MAEKKPWYRKSVAELMGKETPAKKTFAEFQAEAAERRADRAAVKQQEQAAGPTLPWWDDPTVSRAVTQDGTWSRLQPDSPWHCSRRMKTTGPYSRDEVAEQALPHAEIHMRFGIEGQRIYTGPPTGGGGGI